MTTARFLTPLRVVLLHQTEGWRPKWALLSALHFNSNVIDRAVVVPGGFVFDGESVPVGAGCLGPLAPQCGAVHDWLYQAHDLESVSKEQSDLVYREALISIGIHPVWAEQRYNAVRDYGGNAFASGPSRLEILDVSKLPSLPYEKPPEESEVVWTTVIPEAV